MLIIILLFTIALIALILIVLHELYFLRKPLRKVPQNRTIISPANGKIEKIIPINQPNMKISKGKLGIVNMITSNLPKDGYVIVITMNIFNVHYQRAPIDGRVISIKHRNGLYKNAISKSLLALYNEKSEITLKTEIGIIKVLQVAGFAARRIHVTVKNNQKVHKGQEIGYISLGSQVILTVPKLKLKIKEGQKVIDGETVIADY